MDSGINAIIATNEEIAEGEYGKQLGEASGRSARAKKQPDRFEQEVAAPSKRFRGSNMRKKGKMAKMAQDDAEVEAAHLGERRSSRSAAAEASTSLREAESDDEFARENFMFGSKDEERQYITKRAKSKSVKKSKGNNGKGASKRATLDGDSSSDDGLSTDDSDASDADNDVNGDKVEYRIQYILASKTLTPAQWRPLLSGMNTREVTRGSVWQMPDEEFLSESDVPVERMLIKWQHASFLHVSWETERDILDLVGSQTKNAISKFRNRELVGLAMFEDLARGEFFLPQFVQVDRVLYLEDDAVHVQDLDVDRAVFPSDEDMSDMREGFEVLCPQPAAAQTSDEDKCILDKADDSTGAEENAPNGTTKVTRTRVSSTKRAAARNRVGRASWLHGGSGWLTIKWEGLPYSEATVESLEDLRAAGVDYERALRAFMSREQMEPASGAQLKRFKRSLQSGADTVSYIETDEPPAMCGGELRDYQWEGVRWLLFNWSQRRNSILADEMGLGKTIQTAAFLQLLKSRQNVRGPFLIVAPLSVVINWEREMKAWTDMDVIVYHGSAEDRELIRNHEFRYQTRDENDKRGTGHRVEVVVTSPETCLASDHKTPSGRIVRELSRIEWGMLVVDEAHRLKNSSSRICCALRDEFKYSNCVLLTGTPLQNSTEELWTLLNFVDHRTFASKDKFASEFGDLQSSNQLSKLHGKIGPYLLRREKEIVEKSVPPKEEVIVEVELTNPQKQYYRAIYEMNTSFLCKPGAKEMPSLTNLAMEIRKCCNHPFLVKGAEEEISKHFSEDGQSEADPLTCLVQASGKMVLLDKLLPKLKRDGHRVLIFSQFRIMLNLLEDYMNMAGHSYERIDGSVTGKKRQSAIDRYSAPDSDIFVMLLSTRAGGVGINLTSADTVIVYDSDWNPQNDLQAQARAHRIGQQKMVKVYRLLTRKTYEQRMFEVASMKLGLDYAVMSNLHGFKKGDKKESGTMSSMSKKELENLLKFGAYDIFKEGEEGGDEMDRASREFCDADIDAILARSTKVVHDGKTADANATAHASTFAKASFVAAGGTETASVNVDDPDFWNKIVGLSVTADKEEEQKRRRCRSALSEGAYREPGMNFQMIEKDAEGGYDSDVSINAVTRGRRESRVSKIDKEHALQQAMESWPLDPSGSVAADISTVLPALCARGYGAWAAIKRDAAVRWSDAAVAKHCRLGIVILLLQACIHFDDADEDDETTLSVDMPGVMVRLASSRVCRLALCAAALGAADSADKMSAHSSGGPIDPLESLMLKDCVVSNIQSKSTSVARTADQMDTVDEVSTDSKAVEGASDRLCDVDISLLSEVPGLEGLASLAKIGRLSAGHYHYITPKIRKSKSSTTEKKGIKEDTSDLTAGSTMPQEGVAEDTTTASASPVTATDTSTPTPILTPAQRALAQRDEAAAELLAFLRLLLSKGPTTTDNNTDVAPEMPYLKKIKTKLERQRVRDKLALLDDLFEGRLAESINVTEEALSFLPVVSDSAEGKEEMLGAQRIYNNIAPVRLLLKALENDNELEMRPFQVPVDAKDVVGYKKIVRVPMDLTTIRRKMETLSYTTYLEPVMHLRLMFKNAKAFNRHHMDEDPVSKAVFDAAVTMDAKLDGLLEVYTQSVVLEDECRRRRASLLSAFLSQYATTRDMGEKGAVALGYEPIPAPDAAPGAAIKLAADGTDVVATEAEVNVTAAAVDVATPVSRWTPENDVVLLTAVQRHGIPDNRTRFKAVVHDVCSAVVDAMGVPDSSSSSGMDIVVAPKMPCEDAGTSTDAHEAADTPTMTEEDEDAEDARDAAMMRVASTLHLTDRPSLSRRLKALFKALRGANTLPTPMNAYVEEKKEKKEKPPAAAPPLNRKKFGVAVLKTLSRIGRPRKLYASALAPEDDSADDDEGAGAIAKVPEDRHHLLLTWDKLHAEVALEYSARALINSVVTPADVKELTLALLAARKASPCRDPKLLKSASFDAKAHPFLVECDILPKAVVECCDRMETAHRLRCALAFMDDSQLARALEGNARVPGFGASVPLLQRDHSLPVWWTYHHDVRLLKAALVHGHQFPAAAWKRLEAVDAAAVASSASTPAADSDPPLLREPDGFTLPPREKVDWVLELTPKVAEKRCILIAKVFDPATVCRALGPSARLPMGSPVLARASNPVGLSGLFRSTAPASVPTTAPDVSSTQQRPTLALSGSKPKPKVQAPMQMKRAPSTQTHSLAALSGMPAKQRKIETPGPFPAPAPAVISAAMLGASADGDSADSLAAQLAAIEAEEEELAREEAALLAQEQAIAAKKAQLASQQATIQEAHTIQTLKSEQRETIQSLVERAQAVAVTNTSNTAINQDVEATIPSPPSAPVTAEKASKPTLAKADLATPLPVPVSIMNVDAASVPIDSLQVATATSTAAAAAASTTHKTPAPTKRNTAGDGTSAAPGASVKGKGKSAAPKPSAKKAASSKKSGSTAGKSMPSLLSFFSSSTKTKAPPSSVPQEKKETTKAAEVALSS